MFRYASFLFPCLLVFSLLLVSTVAYTRAFDPERQGIHPVGESCWKPCYGACLNRSPRLCKENAEKREKECVQKTSGRKLSYYEYFAQCQNFKAEHDRCHSSYYYILNKCQTMPSSVVCKSGQLEQALKECPNYLAQIEKCEYPEPPNETLCKRVDAAYRWCNTADLRSPCYDVCAEYCVRVNRKVPPKNQVIRTKKSAKKRTKKK